MLRSAVGGAVVGGVVGGMVVATVVVGAGAALPTWSLIVVPGATSSVDGMLCEMTMPSCTEPVATGTVTTLASRPRWVSWLRAAASVNPSTGGTLTLAGPAETTSVIAEPLATGVFDRRVGAQHRASRNVGAGF